MKTKSILALSLALNACSSRPDNIVTTNSVEQVREIQRSLKFSAFVNIETREECNRMPVFLIDFLNQNNVIIKHDFERLRNRPPNMDSDSSLERQLISYNNGSLSFPPYIYLTDQTECLDEVLNFYISRQNFKTRDFEKRLVLDSQGSFNEIHRFDQLAIDHVSFLLSTIDLVAERGKVDDSELPQETIFDFLNYLENIYMILHKLQINSEDLIMEINNHNYSSELSILSSSLYNLNDLITLLLEQGESQEVINEFAIATSRFESEFRYSLASSSFYYVVKSAMKFLINPASLNLNDFRFGFDPKVINYIRTRYQDFQELP
ncbi:hypothetical protein CL656_03030 [bacterium]|nr:hypothetical protein [bacterium]|tara:strand:- start:640 stop:1602 length:963 start_codon:yes stop_codon:yes gene_type:complete